VLTPGAEPLRLRALGHRVGSGSARAISTGSVAARAISTGTPTSIATGTSTAGSAVAAVTIAARSASVTASVTVTIAGATLLLHEGRGHQRFVLACADDRQHLGLLADGLRRENREDLDALDGEVGVGPDDIADLHTARKNGCDQLALGLLGPGRTPGPGPIGAFTGEFDL